LKWIWFLDWKGTEEFNRQDFYLAQIAAEIERGQVRNPALVTIQRKILKFSSKTLPKDLEDKIQASKNFWVGITRNKKVLSSNQKLPVKKRKQGR